MKKLVNQGALDINAESIVDIIVGQSLIRLIQVININDLHLASEIVLTYMPHHVNFQICRLTYAFKFLRLCGICTAGLDVNLQVMGTNPCNLKLDS